MTIKASENFIDILSYVYFCMLYYRNQQATDWYRLAVEKEPACMVIKRRNVVLLEMVESKEGRMQINSKIVIQICRNDFHPESIPKIPWESPSISAGQPPVHTPNNMYTTLAPGRLSTA